MSCHVDHACLMPRDIMSCHVVSHVMSCHAMSCHVMPCHAMSCHDGLASSSAASQEHAPLDGWRRIQKIQCTIVSIECVMLHVLNVAIRIDFDTFESRWISSCFRVCVYAYMRPYAARCAAVCVYTSCAHVRSSARMCIYICAPFRMLV